MIGQYVIKKPSAFPELKKGEINLELIKKEIGAEWINYIFNPFLDQLSDNTLVLVLDDEGFLKDLELNIMTRLGVVSGTVIVCRSNHEFSKLVGLNHKQINFLERTWQLKK